MKLGSGFLNLVEGPRQTLLISKVAEDTKYDKLKVTFKDERGGTCTEQFILTKNGKPNDVALNMFTTIAMCAMNDFTLREKEFDPSELEGRFIVCDVVAKEVENEETGNVNVYYHVRNFAAADGGWGDGEDDAAEQPEEPDEDDLDADGLFD